MIRSKKALAKGSASLTDFSPRWLALRTAAALIDVSEQMILAYAVPWRDAPVPNRIRFKLLTLGVGQAEEQRFFSPDLDALLTISPRIYGPADTPPLEPARLEEQQIDSKLRTLKAPGGLQHESEFTF